MMPLFLMAWGLIQPAKAGAITIVDVHRNITLSDSDPIYKDFYLNAGPTSGLKKNMVVTAVRKMNVRDANGANSIGEIMIPVGQLKVIAIYDKVSVAREFNLLSRDDLPMLEQIGIMTGDNIELRGAFIDNSKPKKSKVAASSSHGDEDSTITAVTVLSAPSNSDAIKPKMNLMAGQTQAGSAPENTSGSTAGNRPGASASTTPEPELPSTEKLLQTQVAKKDARTTSSLANGESEAKATSKDFKPTEKLEKMANSDNNSGHE